MIGRVAILGGSSVYTPEFISSVIARNLAIGEIVLIGRTEGKLQLVSAFSQRMLDKNGFPTKIVATTDVAEGVKGSNYILNQIRVGGMMARARDERVPPMFDMIGDETLGAGGIANAFRTLPVVLEYARVIERAAPDATLINLTNPMGVIVEALNKITSMNVIGICDVPTVYTKRIAKILNTDSRDIWVDYFGLNHIGWIQDVKVDGRSQMERLLDRITRKKPDGFDVELVELFRMIPTRFVSFFFRKDDILKKQKELVKYRGEELYEAEQLILEQYEDEDLCEVPELTKDRNAVWYEQSIIPLVEGLESDEERELVLCVKNNGALKELPEEAAVEVPAVVSKKGIQVRKVGESPCFLKGLFYSVKASERLTVEAVIQNSYDLALQALVIHPLVPSLNAARGFLDKMIEDENLTLR
jgi:6-phospho-beta-glucosidase